MTEPDWASGALRHEMRVELVDPGNLETVRGGLEGLDASGRLSLDYYGDTRAGLTLSTSVPVGWSDGWDGTAAMRLVHTVGDWSEELFTGYVTSTDWTDASGMRKTSYTLNSCLYGLQTDRVGWPYTVGAGAMGLDAIERVLDKCSRPYRVLPGALDYRFGSATVYEADKTWLSVAFDLADRSGDRLDVDGRGMVTVGRYDSPSARTPSIVLDTSDPMAVTVGQVGGSSNALDIPSRVVVHASDGESELTGWAYQPASSPYTNTRRGYNLDSYHDESDMEPFTQAQADALASSYLSRESSLVDRRTASMMYRPLRTGQVVELRHSGETDRYMVSTAELDLSTWTWSLDLKGVS